MGTQVFDTALIQNITADLMTPANVGFAVLQFLLFGHTLAHFMFKQARFQHRHGFSPVAVL